MDYFESLQPTGILPVDAETLPPATVNLGIDTPPPRPKTAPELDI